MKVFKLLAVALMLAFGLKAEEIASGVIAGTDITIEVNTAQDLMIGENRFLIKLTREGQPLSGAQLEARAFKPNHGPQMPARDFRAQAVEGQPGIYEAKLPLDHKCGTWRFGLNIEKDGNRLGAFRAPMPFL